MRENKKLTMYLLWAFGLGWGLQLIACWFFARGNALVYRVLLILLMFSPLAAALLSRSGIKGLGWRPHIKKDIKYILLAWLFPGVLMAVGAALYFLLFPAAFDTTFSYLAAQVGEEGMAQLEAQGMTMSRYAVISVIQAVTFAPFLNMIPAMGEEAGWRGVMYPALRERFGTLKGRLLGGVIWGAWHWPVMILAGYEYGTGYWGEPVTGMVLFCVFTAAFGILMDWLYEKTDCIWLPALGHGSINGFASLPVLFLDPAFANRLLVGPLVIGVIGGLPMFIAAALVSVKRGKGRSNEPRL